MSRLRNDLPPEVLKIVLARPPGRVLSGVRLVCKTWNHRISQRGFASLRAQAPRRASSVLITPKMMDFIPPLTQKSWEILEVAEKRFYILRDSKYLLGYISRWLNIGRTKYTLAADGEFVYVVCESLSGGESIGQGDQTHILCNPATKDIHQVLPEPDTKFPYDRNIVVLSVDNVRGFNNPGFF